MPKVKLVAVSPAGSSRGRAIPPEPGLIAHSLAVAVVFLVSIPIAYRFGPNPAQWSWLSLAILIPVVSYLSRRRTSPQLG